jgi:hypothetical protein
MMSEASSAILGIVAGIVGGVIAWAGAQFFARDYDRFRETRATIAERLFFYADAPLAGLGDLEKVLEAQRALRSCAAQLHAVERNAYTPVLRFLKWRGYNLAEAVRCLTGLSNGIAGDHSDRFTKELRDALKLPY